MNNDLKNELRSEANRYRVDKSYLKSSYLFESYLLLEPNDTKVMLILANIYIRLKENFYRNRAKILLENYFKLESNPLPIALELLINHIYLVNGPKENIDVYAEKFKHLISKEFYLRLNAYQNQENIYQKIIDKNALKKVVIGKFPENIKDFENINSIINNFLLTTPPKKILTDKKIFTFGSCFSRNVSRALRKREISVTDFYIPEEVNTIFSNLNILNYLFNKKIDFADFYQYLLKNHDEKALAIAARESEVFIYTAGLASAFFDIEKKSYIPHSSINLKSLSSNKNSVHRFSSVDENIIVLEKTMELLKEETDFKHLFVTVSPVPLSSSIGDSSAIVADMESKSILRNAVGIFSRLHEDCVTYFPSFEIFRSLPCFMNESVFGSDDGNSRHPNHYYVEQTINAFIKKYA